ncbi:MAG: hypothetical protein Fur0037_22630 [Planctomycetota bacterium]
MIVFGSRHSDLAMAQTRHVAERVRAVTGEPFEIVHIETTGDRVLERPLDAIGVKGAFTRELEEALRSGRIDAAVHSLKDLPVEDAPGLCVGAIPERVDPRDVLIAREDALDPAAGDPPLKAGARVGTSSPRRRLALSACRKDLATADVRGNVPTRVRKVRDGDYDATLLAGAGLKRLGLDLSGLASLALDPGRFVPAPGQGALAVQCRAGDSRVRGILSRIHDSGAARCVEAERRLLLGLGGGCSLPLGALCTEERRGFRLRAALFAPNGAALQCDAWTGDIDGLVERLAFEWRALRERSLRGVAVLLPRPDGEGGDLAEALRFCGAGVEVVSWTRTEAIEPTDGGREALERADALAFTSARAARRYIELAGGFRSAEKPRCFAVGRATAAALLAGGFDADVAGGSGGAALAALAAASLGAGAEVVYPCAQERRPAFEEGCAARGVRVVPVPVYRTSRSEPPAAPFARPDVVLVTAPSSVFGLAAVPETPCVAIGSATAEAMREIGITPAAVCADAGLVSVVETLAEVRA